MHYVNFAVFVVFLIEVVMKKCYISTLARQQIILGKNYPVIAYRHTGLGPGRVGSRVTLISSKMWVGLGWVGSEFVWVGSGRVQK